MSLSCCNFACVQLAAYNVQLAAYNMQRATCSIQRAACNVQHATCSIQRAAYSVQHATCSMQRAAYSVEHATCNMQRAACRFAARNAHYAPHGGWTRCSGAGARLRIAYTSSDFVEGHPVRSMRTPCGASLARTLPSSRLACGVGGAARLGVRRATQSEAHARMHACVLVDAAGRAADALGLPAPHGAELRGPCPASTGRAHAGRGGCFRREGVGFAKDLCGRLRWVRVRAHPNGDD